MAFALATALALGSTTLAFVPATSCKNPDPKTRRDRISWTPSNSQSWPRLSTGKPLFPLFPSTSLVPQSVQCEAQSLPNDNNNIDELQLLPRADDLVSSELYERINPPARMDEHSHAVGQLLQPQKIERYEIYRHREATAAASNQIKTTSPLHIVTALVQFGDSLDGHPGIVHGGILALALDDIFGFSFHAIGVPMAFTANLSLDYRTSLPADSSVLIHVLLEQRDNRKLYFKADVTSLDGDVLYTEATCLYIIPRSVWEKMEEKRKGK